MDKNGVGSNDTRLSVIMVGFENLYGDLLGSFTLRPYFDIREGKEKALLVEINQINSDLTKRQAEKAFVQLQAYFEVTNSMSFDDLYLRREHARDKQD
uniref:hypothetical protein n=1 Tax=Pediococcus pentosaceus TaxID=1255 RepID=UPI00155DAB7C|nr:hypothetical protein [Pediococcus pentosaceus]